MRAYVASWLKLGGRSPLEQAERIVIEDEHIKTWGLKIKKEDIEILEEVFICE